MRHFRGADGKSDLGVHVSGILDDSRPPIICLADLVRNMADYGAFVRQFRHQGEADWPIILIDLAGRGRARDRANPATYSSINDARDVACVAAALGVEKAIIVGQGHGGKVGMALGSVHGELLSGIVLIDSAPVVHAPSLVRLRDNMNMLLSLRDRDQFRQVGRQIFLRQHPGLTPEELDDLVERIFFWRSARQVVPVFDKALLKNLLPIQFDDIFEPQWPLFNTLSHCPMMLMRTQLTDQMERATFERMGEIRSDAVQLVIPGQGSPALLSGWDEVGAIMDFAHHARRHSKQRAMVWG